MAKKTNKTSHVLDLLTNGSPSEAADSAPERKNDVQSHTVTPKKVTVVDEGSRNDRLSQEILNKLSEELEQENSTAPQTAQTPSEPVQNAAPAPEPVQQPAAPQAEQAPSAEPQLADASQTNIPVAPAQNRFGDRLNKEGYYFLNVMEQMLLHQDVEGLMKENNVCTCNRCIADVCAIALSALPSKYVVTSQHTLSPILSYYDSRYRISMLTELFKACTKVRENPRHEK